MKISIIIPVYNVAPYLRECLRSVIAAAEGVGSREWGVEVICVDDGSTDGSGEILEEFSRHSTPSACTFKILHQQNLGVSAARNVALEQARGEWIAFVDADDTVDADWFVKMMAHATKEVDWVHADSAYCFEGCGSTTGDGRSYRTILRDGWPFLNVVRREVVGTMRFPVGMRFKEDVIFFTALALKNPRIAWVKETGYDYRRHPGSAIEQRISEQDSLRFCEEILKLDLPRADAGRAIGYDLVLWVKGRDWSKGYDPNVCAVLGFWRDGLAAGRLKISDVRWWWRPGLWHWTKTGDLSWLVQTRDWRVRLELAWRRLRGLRT